MGAPTSGAPSPTAQREVRRGVPPAGRGVAPRDSYLFHIRRSNAREFANPAKGNGGKWTSSRSSRRAPSSSSARRSPSSSSPGSTGSRSRATSARARTCGMASACIAGLLLIALIVWQGLRLANIELEIGVTPSMITAALAVLTLVFVFIRWIDKPGGDSCPTPRPDDLGLARPRPRDRARGRRVAEHAGRRRGPRRHSGLRRRRHGSGEGRGRPRRQACRRRSRAAEAPACSAGGAARPAGGDTVRHRGGTAVGAGRARRHTRGRPDATFHGLPCLVRGEAAWLHSVR